MKSNSILRVLVILIILTVTIGCDQVSKKIVREKVSDYQTISVIHNYFTIEKVENTGAFLSMGDAASKPLRIIFLDVIPLILILLSLVYILIKTDINKYVLLAIILMIGGGIGNIYDRIVHGSVTDFLYINFGLFHTGVFNIADLCITTGISIILLRSWFKKQPAVQIENMED
ncbi:MAG: lspA [Mucilaginibacter sp.]|nr:lspA [Mucilaginibacter sp.]